MIRRDIKPAGPDSVILHGAHPGDEFVFYRWDFSPLDFQAKVVRLDGPAAILDRKLPADLPASFIARNAREHTDNWIIKDSYLHDYYGRLLICAPRGLITGNEIHNSYVHIGAHNATFDSSGIASQITVNNNLFVQTIADTGIWGADSTYPVFGNITFACNSFVGPGLVLRNAGAPMVYGNYFENRPEDSRKPETQLDRRNHYALHPAVRPGQCGTLRRAQNFDLTSRQTDGLTEGNNSLLNPAAEAAPLNASLR